MYDLSFSEGAARLSSHASHDAALLRASTELFVQQAAHDRDAIQRFEDLATHLLPRVAPVDRLLAATLLAARIDAPLSVVRMLSRDEIEIAEPILARTPVLGSFDLLTVIAATGPEHHRLIARRAGLGEDVVRALQLTGDPIVCEILDGRAGAATPAAPAPMLSNAPGNESPAQRDELGDIPLKAARDPWIFLTLDRTARLGVLRQMAANPPVHGQAGAEPGGPHRAFRSILGAAQVTGHARKGRRAALVDELALGLDLAPDLIGACLDDATGEPLAILLKALSLDAVQAQQVMLLASPVGRDAAAFFKLCDLFAGMEAHVAEALVVAWRKEDPVRPARHQPLYADTEDRVGRDQAARRGRQVPERRADRETG